MVSGRLRRSNILCFCRWQFLCCLKWARKSFTSAQTWNCNKVAVTGAPQTMSALTADEFTIYLFQAHTGKGDEITQKKRYGNLPCALLEWIKIIHCFHNSDFFFWFLSFLNFFTLSGYFFSTSQNSLSFLSVILRVDLSLLSSSSFSL